MNIISACNFKNGITLKINNDIMQVIGFQHVKPGKGAAFVRTKLKNIITGCIIDKTFRPIEKFYKVNIKRINMQYLYNDKNSYYFMNNKTYEQISINKKKIYKSMKFIKNGENVKICFYNNKIFNIEIPLFVELYVTNTEPGFKGNSINNINKQAVVETGAIIYVPLFINKGDKIKIDTRTNKYLSRVL